MTVLSPRVESGRGRRLLIVSDTLVGGHGAAVLRHAEWFRGAGWIVGVAAPEGEPHALVDPGHIPVSLPGTIRSARLVVAAVRELRAVRRAWRPDVIHAQGARSFAITRAAGWRAHGPTALG